MLFEQLSQEEREIIENYIDENAFSNTNCSQRSVPLQHILRIWDSEKQSLFHLFGDQLILSKSISFKKEEEELEAELSDIFSKSGNFNKIDQFFSEYETTISNIFDPWSDLWSLAISLIHTSALAKNTYEGEPFYFPLKNGRKIKIQRGSKIAKTLGKIAESYELKGFEEFRIAHSQILNQKEIKGNLCLSIHPLDFMTLSDNDCGWDSCMTWTECNGYYRQGTVEMMNSPCVIVAYLEAEDPYPICKDSENKRQFYWNNKKWRELFIVDENVITNVKAYPYRNWSITEMVLDWLKELAENAGLGTYTKNAVKYHAFSFFEIKELKKTVNVSFFTGMMYNDFGDNQMGYFNTQIPERRLEITYSGEPECMACGETDVLFEDESHLVCQECSGDYYTCDCCGQRIPVSDDIFYIDGEGICPDCFDCNTYQDIFTEENHLEENMKHLYVSFDNGKTIYLPSDYCLIDYNSAFAPKEYEDCFSHLYLGNGDYGVYYFVMAEDLTEDGLDCIANVKTVDELKSIIMKSRNIVEREIFNFQEAS